MDTMANNSNNINNNLLNGLPEERGWEYKQVTVTRVPGYGFGIAVSGGRDNPHFASGDPSIAVSDVLASGPAERMLQVNDRIISVNGISLQNVDYATAVQVLRDSGDTVVLVVKRRTAVGGGGGGGGGHQHTGSYVGLPLAALGVNPLPPKVTLTRSSKKEDFGIVLGCKLFVKEISSKAREQLLSTNQIILEGDFVTKINNTSCNDVMSIKEAKKIIDSTKDKLQLTVVRTGDNITPNISHQAQSSVSTTGAVNNFYKGDDFLTSGQSYSNQNLYVQPPTRNNVNMNNSSSGDFDDKIEGSGPNSLQDDKSNLVNKGRSRGPLSEANLNQFDNRNSMGGYGRSKGGRDEPPRPPPPRAEDYYSSRRQLYDDDPIVQKTKQPIPDARFITFHKEGSVGIRLTGGNSVGIFVTAVQPGSPASLQGLQPGDKILKVNDMDMKGVTREEAVLFLLSLVDRIELIVQFCKEEYDGIVASQKGDSFYIKTHFHYENPAKGEMSFRSGDIFHVIDTLYNGVVGCWQVFRIGRNNQEVQKGIIPNKARAEELATAQFNATKKEMSANESRGSFFRRRRSSNRRSKSLGKEHWDDILFSDTISKFPAYERVVLKHPGFTRPVILFGPISDVAREKLLKDFPDKFISPQLDVSAEESKSKEKVSSNIIRLSAIKDVISTGKHALLDITPNAVERLNYAQMYPIVVFFKADTKIIIKQLRQGLPKSAHKSSKKLLEQCQKLDKVWNHIFCATITLNDNTDNWYRKVREIIDKQQSGALWMSESKPEESLSDDFLFPMSSLRLSYASSPESDLEHSPGPPVSPGLASNGSGHGAGGRLTKASSDPSVVMPDAVDVLPPYQASYDSRYGFSNPDHHLHATDAQLPPSPGSPGVKDVNYIPSNQEPNSEATYGKNHQSPIYSHQEYHHQHQQSDGRDYKSVSHKRQMSSLHGNFGGGSKGMKEAVYGGVMAPDLPPRVDRAVKPMGLLTTPGKIPNGKSAHERLFGTKPNVSGDVENSGEFVPKMSSLERSQNSKSDSLSSYDSFNNPQSKQSNPRIMPNAHDDLKTTLSKLDPSLPNVQNSPSKYGVTPSSNRWQQQQRHERVGSKLDLKYGGIPQQQQQNVIGENEMLGDSPRGSRELDPQRGGSIERESKEEGYGRYGRSPGKRHVETKTDYGKYSRNNSSAQDYAHRTSSSSHQDLTQSHLSVVQQMQQHHMSPMKHTTNGLDSNGDLNHLAGQSGNNGPSAAYKPIPPPKPKNYKPPYKNQQNAGGGGGGGGYAQGDGMMQPPLPYQHGKSHSNPVDHQRGQNFPPNHNYYYNMPQTPPHNNGGNWHTETAVRYNSGMMQQQQQHHHQSQYDMAPPYHQARRQTSISYASRSEITPIAQHDGGGIYDGGADVVDIRQPERPSIVDLQGSREQRGSAFELYRKPVQHNLRERLDAPTLFGSQPNIARRLNTPPATNKITPTPPSSKSRKLSKSQSFRLARDLPTPNFLRRLLGGGRASPASATPSPPPTGSGRRRRGKFNSEEMSRASRRDVTSAVVDRRGARLVNEYWGVTLEVPEGALPDGAETEIYFVVSDPRLCDETPPLDSENGETMLSPMVMCGPQGIQFQKPVILNIPHYANTLPSLGISLKATDSEQDVCTDWDSILLPSNHAANSVAVKVDHF